MVAASTSQQPYLASATGLIKALKSARDPPQPDWPSKIEIATQAWQRKDQIGQGLGGRIGDVIREWLLESWLKSKSAKGAKNDLLHAAYHDLLRSIISEHRTSTINGVSPTQSQQFLTAFIHALRLTPELATEELLLSASRLFKTLFGHSTSDLHHEGELTNGALVKAENWLETLGGLIALCSYAVDQSSPSVLKATLKFDATRSEGLRGLTELVVVEMNASLAMNQNRRKITLNLIKPLIPVYLKVLRALPLVQEPLYTLVGPLFWPLAVLQPQTQSSQASSSEILRDPAETVLGELVYPILGNQSSNWPTSDTLALLSFLPKLSEDYVAALQANRYTIFPPPSSASAASRARNGSSVPPDVYVGDKVREGVQKYTRLITQFLEKIELGLEAASTEQRSFKADSATLVSNHKNIRLEIWKSRHMVWSVVKRWGGYFEGDEDWRLLVSDTVAGASQWLSTSGLLQSFNNIPVPTSSSSKETADQVEHQTYACIEGLFRTLLEIDYGACKVDVDTEGKSLFAASLLNGTVTSSSPIHAILRYHALTQSIPDFANLLISAVQLCFSSSSTSIMAQRDIYGRVASGPLITPEFRHEFEKALAGTFVGGISEERGWGLVLMRFGAALRDSTCLLEETRQTQLSMSDAPSKRRRKNNGQAAPVASPSSILPTGAGAFAVFSRLMCLTLETAYGRGQGYERQGKAEDILRIVDLVSQSWRNHLPSSVGEEVIAGVLRLRKAEGLLRREALPSMSFSVTNANEAFFEQAGLQLQTYSISETPGVQPLSDIVAGLATPEAPSAWSGAVVDINPTNSHIALWHLVAQRGITVFEENATEQELETFCRSLLTSASHTSIIAPDSNIQKELLATQAIDRVINSAEFWEMGRIRSAILRIVQQAIDDKTSTSIISMLQLLLRAPLDFLTKTVRNAVTRSVYEIDASGVLPESTRKLAGSEQELLRHFMVKVIKDTEQLGPLSELQVIMRLIEEDTSSSGEVELATRDLISIAISALFTDDSKAITQNTLTELIRMASTKLNTNGPRLQCHWYIVIRQIFQSANENTAGLPSEVSSGLTQLSQVALETFTAQLRTEDDTLFTTRLLDMVQQVGVLCAVTRYRVQSSSHASHRELAESLCLRAMTVWNRTQADSPEEFQREEAAGSILQLAVSQSNPCEDIGDMKAYLSLWSAFAALLGKYERLETQLRDVFASCSGAVFGPLLDLLATVLEREVDDRRGVLVPSLRALSVATSLTIPHTGRLYRAALGRILSGLRRLEQRRDDAEVQLQCLRLLQTISSEKTVILVHQDVSDMLTICYSSILPRMSTSMKRSTSIDNKAPNRHLAAILAIVGSLVRHRRDLVINVLPQLMKLYARILELFGIPRSRSTVGGSEERVRRLVQRQWPIWLSSGFNEEDGRSFARALETLTSRTTIRTTTAHSNSAAGTMIGQLSKHAPVLLIAYVRAVAHPLSTIPASIRHQLTPGIGAMCEAVVAGGKAMLGGAGSVSGGGGASENRTAESIGEAFGLGEGPGGEGELVIWGEMWRAWRRSRYVGQG